MKTSKPTIQKSSQEECGVWLDTVQLKVKAKQKRLSRPISKLLNPFVGGGGYSLAVALNFTQTKIEMPKTKQSNISSFFAPQSRVVNKMLTSEEQNMDPVQPSSSSTSSTPVELRTKRKRDVDLETFDFCGTEPGVMNPERKCEKVTEPEAAVWLEQVESSPPSQHMSSEFQEEPFEEMNSPQRKRRLTAASSLPGDSQPPQAWSQDPLLSCSQYLEDDFYLTAATNPNNSEQSFLNEESDDAVIFQFDVEGRTSTQKSFKPFDSSQTDDDDDDDKENSRNLSSKSPRRPLALSHIEPHKRTGQKTASPRKHCPVSMWERADKEESLKSRVRWTKPSHSPLKKKPQLSHREADDSLAMLFTQDSEGFRVIAHRELRVRSPLKEQSNVSTSTKRTSSYKCLEEEEDEMLFTQDSQGNMVIKH